MKLYIFLISLLISGCQSTSQNSSKHFLDGVTPDIGKYGYKSEKTADYWGIHNSAYSKNEVFGLLNLNWASLGKDNRFMWLTTMPGGEKYCDYRDVHSGKAALKINGKWVKSDFSCMSGGVLSFSIINKFSAENMKIDVAVVFDFVGNAEKVYELGVLFDNSGAINAMKYAYDESVRKSLSNN
jgi:hypothetical protein